MANINDSISIRNEGLLFIGQSGTSVSMYIDKSLKQVDNARLTLDGRLVIGDGLVHDATGNFFNVDKFGYSTSRGTVVFKGQRGKKRYVMTSSSTFDRGLNYIAFPNIELQTNDSILIPGTFGVDVSSLVRMSGFTGGVVLESKNYNDNIYNASLRVTGTGNSASLVTPGAVIVQLDVSPYRKTQALYPFTTPFNGTQMAGYFAGNWIRAIKATGKYNNVVYPMANKPSKTNANVISADQYITSASYRFLPGNGQLIKPRPDNFDFSALLSSSGLGVAGNEPSLADMSKYIFDGSVYNLTPYNEQVFADDNLFSYSINATPDSTVNWVIGNSYTAPLSVARIIDAINNSPLVFSNTFWTYPAGSTSYVPYVMNSSDAIQLADVKEVPSMGLFMIRLKKGVLQKGTFVIGKSMLEQGNVPHNAYKVRTAQNESAASLSAYNQVVLSVSALANSNVYDKIAVGLRSQAALGPDNYDVSKILSGDAPFQLSALNANNLKLSIDGVPDDVERVQLWFKSSDAINYRIKAENFENLSTDCLILEDVLTGIRTDLRSVNAYDFSTTQNEEGVRFNLLFKTFITDVPAVQMYYSNEMLNILMLLKDDVNARISLYDVLGKQVYSGSVDSYPSMKIYSKLTPGVYVIKIEGVRNLTQKFIVY